MDNFQYSFEFLVNLVCNKTNTDVGFDPFWDKMEHWPHSSVPLAILNALALVNDLDTYDIARIYFLAHKHKGKNTLYYAGTPKRVSWNLHITDIYIVTK